MMEREIIPADMKRQVLVEAGHRCAIPTCRQTPVELAHIEPWAKVQCHEFANLIALCPTCHTRYDKGEIDRKAMLIYKHNLALLNSRYGEIERRILQVFAETKAQTMWLPGGLDILILNLLRDDLLEDTGKNSGAVIAGMPSQKLYGITDKGRAFIDRWMWAQEIE